MESLRSLHHAAVILGGVNMDICGKPYKSMVKHDSNPGVISACPGGVGRNIAHDLRLLGMETELIAALGGDIYGIKLLESCKKLGIGMDMSPVFPNERSSTYLYITDEQGDMQLAVADMDITKRITPELLAQYMDRINACACAVFDANLEAETLEYAAKHITIPMYADTVSTAKAPRIKNVLPYLTAIKPNLIEAQTLTGKIRPEDCAKALLDMGVKKVFLSLGAEGIIAADSRELIRIPCDRCKIVNTTGAGDAAMAAIVWADMRGLSLEETARIGVLAGTLTCMDESANSPKLSSLTDNGGRYGK